MKTKTKFIISITILPLIIYVIYKLVQHIFRQIWIYKHNLYPFIVFCVTSYLILIFCNMLAIKQLNIENHYTLHSIGLYSLYIYCWSIAIRLFLTFFKSAAIGHGEAETRDEEGLIVDAETAKFRTWTRGDRYFYSFFNLGNHKNTDDYWLPAIIGSLELAMYPIFMQTYDKWYYIVGGWVTIKAAARWGKWKESRTPYNRFLLGNLIVIIISYLFLKNFIIKT